MQLRPIDPVAMRRRMMLYANNGGNLRQMLRDGSAFYAPRTSTITQTRGAGTPTETRATVATVTNNDGYLVTALSGEARFTGARRIRNIIRTTSEDFSNAAWLKQNAGSGVLPVVTSGFADPDGGLTAYRVQLDNGGVGSGYSQISNSGSTSTAGPRSLWIKSNTGASQILSLVYNTASAKITATTEWQRISVSPSAAFFVFDISTKADLGTTQVIDVLVWRAQLEDVTAQTTQTAGEYVSVGVLSAPFHGAGVDGVRYFSTDISGAPIPAATLKGALVEAEATNLCLQSNAFTTTWVNSGLASITQNAAGPDGSTSAWTLTDSTGAGASGITQNITLTAASYTQSIFIKKTAAATTYPVILVLLAATTGLAGVTIDTNNGVATAWTAYTGFTGITGSASCMSHDANYWRVSLTFTGTAAVWTLRLYPTGTSNATQSTGIIDGVLQGSAVFYGAQVELGSYASSYIPTTTAAVTRNKDILDDQVSSNLTAAAGTVAFTWTPSHDPSGTIALCGSYVDADNYTTLLHNGTDYILRKRIAATNYDATLTAAFTNGTAAKISLTWGASGINLAVDGVLGTADTTGIEGVQYGKLPGTAGAYFSTPDSVANSITGDIDIRVKCALTDYTNGASQGLVSKDDVGANRDYGFFFTSTGAIAFYSSAMVGVATSSAITGFTDGTTHWVRVTRASSSGDTYFYTSDDGATWTQLGTVQNAGAGALPNSAISVLIGMFANGTYSPAAGNIYRAQIYNGIDGTLVVDFDPADYAHGTTWASSATGEVYTINGDAAVWPAVKLGTRWQWGADGNGGQQAGACFKKKFMLPRACSDSELKAMTV